MKKVGVLFNRENFLPFFFAVLLFVGTTGIVSSHIIGICMILIVLTTKKRTLKLTPPFAIIFLIIFLSLINEFIHILTSGDGSITPLELIPYSFFIFFTMWAAKIVDEKVLRWMLWFAVLDVGVAVFQRIVGINSFFPESAVDMDFEDAILYNLKVNGLHDNSSGLGYISFLALIIYDCFPSCRLLKRWQWYVICMVGIFLSFNRTMMLALTVYFGLLLLRSRYRMVLLPLAIIAIVIVFTTPEIKDIILFQFTRGGDSFQSGNAMSGREVVYPTYIRFIKEHLLLGNGSFKYYIGEGLHAHNSVLQTLSANGIIISLLYFLMITLPINRRNYIYVLPFLVCAMTQAFILWGASFNDFVFYCILLRRPAQSIATLTKFDNSASN